MATNYELWTFRDVLERLLDVAIGGNKSQKNLRNARAAITEAYRDLPNRRQWKYYKRRLRLATVASQIEGTVAYTHSSRTLTLTGSTWPTDVLDYSLLIDNCRYEIESQTSSTELVLSIDMNPGADLAAQTVYKLFKDTFPLPDTFVAMGKLQDTVDPKRIMRDATLDELTENNRFYYAGLPTSYTIGPHPRYRGGLAIVLAPFPTTARTYESIVELRPRSLVTELYTDGTVSTTVNSTAVTGGGEAAFTSAHAGCVIRFSSNATQLPTSVIGGSDDTYNLCAFQRVIRSVTNATTLVLDQPADQTLTNVKYTISDPIDIEHGTMLNAFLRLCELLFASAETGRSAADVSRRAAAAETAWLEAASADQRGGVVDSLSPTPWYLPDMANSVNNEP